MRNITFLFLFLFISYHSISQDRVIDSLELELNNNISEKEKAHIFLELSKKTWSNNPDKSLVYANKAIEIAVANSFENIEANGYKNLAAAYIYSQNYTEAIRHLNNSIRIAKNINDRVLEAKNYTNLGALYFYKNDYYKSFLFYDKALKVYRKENNISLIATSLNNISIIYFQTKDYEKALEYTLESNAVLKNSNSIELAKSFQVTAECYSKLMETELAIEFARKSISIFENKDEKAKIAFSYILIGYAYLEAEDYENAHNTFNFIKERIELSNDESLEMVYSGGLAEVFYNLGRYEEALLYAHKSFKIAKALNDIEAILETSKIIAETSSELKKYSDSKSFYKIHINYKDSLIGDNFYRGKFKHELNETIYKNKKEKEIETSKRKNLLLLVVTGFLLLLTFLGLYFYRKLNKLYRIADVGNKAKSIFLSKVTHEIKTPLTSIIGFSELLKDSSLDKEQVLEYNDNIAISSNRLLKLSNEILEFSTLKNEKVILFISKQNLNTLLNSINEYYTIEAKQKGLTFNIEYSLFDSYLFYDKNKLRQVIDNLLVNAIKFTDSGEILLKIDIEHENENEVHVNFTVKDSGIGINEENIGEVQKEFYQIVNNEKDNVGIGLGLSIVNENLYLMNSKLDILSQLNYGSIFSFKLKLRKGELLKKEKAIDKISYDKTVKILVVEDNKLTSLLMKKTLESFLNNIEIYFAYDGFEAVKGYLEEKPNIILMDLQMPNLDGFEATKSIRELQKTYIPIIAFSATLIGDNIEKCNAYGFDDYIEKPISKELLKSIFFKHINVTK